MGSQRRRQWRKRRRRRSDEVWYSLSDTPCSVTMLEELYRSCEDPAVRRTQPGLLSFNRQDSICCSVCHTITFCVFEMFNPSLTGFVMQTLSGKINNILILVCEKVNTCKHTIQDVSFSLNLMWLNKVWSSGQIYSTEYVTPLYIIPWNSKMQIWLSALFSFAF